MISPVWDEMPACHDLAKATLFDPPIGQAVTAEDRARYKQAAALCATCPMLERCATDDTVQQSHGFRHGVLFMRDKNGKPIPVALNRQPKRVRRPRVIIERTHKPCGRCRNDWPIDNYRRDRTRGDGRGVYCKACLHREEITKQRNAA